MENEVDFFANFKHKNIEAISSPISYWFHLHFLTMMIYNYKKEKVEAIKIFKNRI